MNDPILLHARALVEAELESAVATHGGWGEDFALVQRDLFVCVPRPSVARVRQWFFDHATIMSTYSEGEEWYRRAFTFKRTADGVETLVFEPLDQPPTEPRTVVRLQGYVDPYRREAAARAETIASAYNGSVRSVASKPRANWLLCRHESELSPCGAESRNAAH